jgi:hypothetical protein
MRATEELGYQRNKAHYLAWLQERLLARNNFTLSMDGSKCVAECDSDEVFAAPAAAATITITSTAAANAATGAILLW